MSKKMISAMFSKIKKGPARADMMISSKKHFSKPGEFNEKIFKNGSRPNEVEVFHWYGTVNYSIVFHDWENKNHDLIAENFKSWKEAFSWLADWIIENDF